MHQLLNLIKDRLPSHGNCGRIFHGRGKMWENLSHLSIDFYPPNVLITTYKEISEDEKKELVSVIKEIESLSLSPILLQKRYVKGEHTEVLWGEKPAQSFAVENSEKYSINLDNPQNIGFFLDMAIGRNLLRKMAKDKKVLNLFSYTCSLSVAALKGGATEVVNVDMSRASLKKGEENHALNGIEKKQAKFVPYDIMKSFGNIARKGPYDIVIIDPPTNQGESFNAERDYHKIVRRLGDMTNPDAVIFACLNSPRLGSDFLMTAFKEHAPEFVFQEKHYSSFQAMEKNPEEGLKIVLFKKIKV